MLQKRLYMITAALPVTVAASLSFSAPAFSETPYVGQIKTVGENFCPRGWAEANGSLLSIPSYDALFSLYGTIYGGDGRTSFGLPDLRGRIPVHFGQGPGLSSYNIGSKPGVERITVTLNQLANHTHRAGIRTVIEDPNTALPGGAAITKQANNAYRSGTTPISRFMNPESVFVEATGGNQSQSNIMPVQTIKYCVALVGIYPSRN